MTRAILSWCVLLVSALSVAAASAERHPRAASFSPNKEDLFVAVPLDQAPALSGQVLVIAAYAVILGLFLAYGISLVLRERAIQKQLTNLKNRMGSRPST
jgi:hypothetical protein